MNTTSIPTYLITSILDSADKSNIEGLRKTLFEKGVLAKDYLEDGLMLLYHKFDSPCSTELERECRSLIIDRDTLKIKSYSCETPRMNKDGMEYLVSHQTNDSTDHSYNRIINPCYEGTLLSIFYHVDKWFVSTRRCLNSHDSVFLTPDETTETKRSHYDMFMDVLKKDNYETFTDFASKLSTDKSYYFVLIHHENKHLIDYTSQFGTNYSKICLVTVRDEELRELDYDMESKHFQTENVFVPIKLDSIDEFDVQNKVIKYDAVLENEGIVVRAWNTQYNKYSLIKLQNLNYQFAQVMGPEKNIFKGFVYLYQTDKLKDYFNQNTNAQNIRKLVNPLNTTESYDTVGIIDAVFKVCTSELFELFKVLWSLKTGKHQNIELYNMLPKEYKDLLFGVRGIYYKKKACYHEQKTLNPDAIIKDGHLKINDIYTFLKGVSTDNLIAFIRMRKLMFNFAKTNLPDFQNISMYCDKVHLKLTAIFTNRLFPEIMPNDVPPSIHTKPLL